MMISRISIISFLFLFATESYGLQQSGAKQQQRQQIQQQQQQQPSAVIGRRETLGWIVGGTCGLVATAATGAPPAWGASAAIQDTMDVDNFLRTGMDLGGPMGVSSQAGKSRPETGVYLRDGSEVSRDPRSGNVLAEIILKAKDGDRMAALVSFASPWSLAKGSYYDVECRDSKTGDGAFLQVTTDVGGKTNIEEISDSFILENLLAPTGRFSSYGQPTDVKIKKAITKGEYRIIDLSFSTLSQSTQTEIPRKARLVATIPSGAAQAVMLIGSASASRWNKGSDKDVVATLDSFRAIPAPKTSMKLRRKERNSFELDYDQQ